jgi:5'-deoxynucleotidase YfbR-like HD superfamily hydrolase
MHDLYQSWRSGKVNRMHTMPQLHRENIAEHTWGFLYILLRYWPDAPRDVIVSVIFHDAGEIATGDVPGHIKWASPELTTILEQKEKAYIESIINPDLVLSHRSEWGCVLEICDRADFCVSCIHEMRLGNQNAVEYYERSFKRLVGTVTNLEDSPLKTPAVVLEKDLYRLRTEYTSHVS